MKAISLWQPWATLIAIGAKKIETRSWHANYAGRVAIHAAKRFESWTLEDDVFMKALLPLGYIDKTDFPLGQIICTCNIDRTCLIIGGASKGYLGDGTAVEEPEWSFGDYATGRFAWMLSDVTIVKPFPWRGLQKWFQVPDDLITPLQEISDGKE